jgi:hypothetical protein
MDDLKRARTELRHAAYEDSAIRNLKDGYNFDESRKFSEVLLNGLNGSEEWEKNLSDPHQSAVDACNDTSWRGVTLSSQTCVACVLTTTPLSRGDPADHAWQNDNKGGRRR